MFHVEHSLSYWRDERRVRCIVWFRAILETDRARWG
jgi:hypothetical protein